MHGAGDAVGLTRPNLDVIREGCRALETPSTPVRAEQLEHLPNKEGVGTCQIWTRLRAEAGPSIQMQIQIQMQMQMQVNMS